MRIKHAHIIFTTELLVIAIRAVGLNMDKALINSNRVKSIVEAYRHGNTPVLDYALSVASDDEIIKARSRAVREGLEIDYQSSDAGNK